MRNSQQLSRDQLAALIDGLLAVTRARERGEPYWALDVRRAQARIAAQRQRWGRTLKPPG